LIFGVPMLTESNKYMGEVASLATKSTSDDGSTSTESGDEHLHSIKCAPPRISRISQFENKSLKIYNKEHQNKYKTELCRNWELTNNCKFGNKCAYAHGTQDLKEKIFLPSNYKTKVCKQFAEQMYCSYGHRCQFLHEHTSQRKPQNRDNTMSYVEALKQYGKRNEIVVRADDIETFLSQTQEHKRGNARLKVFEALANRDE